MNAITSVRDNKIKSNKVEKVLYKVNKVNYDKYLIEINGASNDKESM